MKPTSRQYIAGLFDGEGSIGIYRCYGGRFVLKTQLVQNIYPESKAVFRLLVQRYGGSASPQHSASGRWKFNWQLGAHKARLFLEDIYPWLRLRKRQAALAIQWQLGKPEPTRNPATGHFNPYPCDRHDKTIALRLKKMKR